MLECTIETKMHTSIVSQWGVNPIEFNRSWTVCQCQMSHTLNQGAVEHHVSFRTLSNNNAFTSQVRLYLGICTLVFFYQLLKVFGEHCSRGHFSWKTFNKSLKMIVSNTLCTSLLLFRFRLHISSISFDFFINCFSWESVI
jgi:hypothetical protein